MESMVFLNGTSRSLSSANFRTFGSALNVEEKSSSNDISTDESVHKEVHTVQAKLRQCIRAVYSSNVRLRRGV